MPEKKSEFFSILFFLMNLQVYFTLLYFTCGALCNRLLLVCCSLLQPVAACCSLLQRGYFIGKFMGK